MAEWRLRDPSSFPPGFHRAMQEGVGEDKVVSQRYTHRAAAADQIQWRIFRFSLRHHPDHPSSSFERGLLHRTRIQWNRNSNLWELLLTSRKSVLEDMEIYP